MTEENAALLEPFFSNLDDQVFVVKNLPGMTGAVMARYSRTQTGLRETLLREFVKQDKLKVRKAAKLIDRVLIAYGDDSVGELEGTHLSFEGISLLATKVIEHRRIGGSPIEQSTRYVRFDFTSDDGHFRYQVPPEIANTPLEATYRREMDRIFTCYGRLWAPLKTHLERTKPLDKATYAIRDRGPESLADMDTDRDVSNFKKTHRMDIKTKTCDILRALLPLATQANVGLFGNGRYFQNLISKMLSSELAEANLLGKKAFTELSTVIPHYVKRAKRSQYLVDNHRRLTALCRRLFGHLAPRSAPGIESIEPDFAGIAQALNAAAGSVTGDQVRAAYHRDIDLNFVTSLAYAYTRAPFEDVRAHIQTLSNDVIADIKDTYYGRRQTRRDRPERAIEFGYPHNFELVTEWAVYKDLMRHRMGTILVQPLVPDMGFKMPSEIQDAGLVSVAKEAVATAETLYQTLATQAPTTAAYAFLQGHYMRWLLSMNDRALMHMLELRSGIQGHPNYRKAAQTMHRLLAARFPDRAARMEFVNHQDVFWSRSDSEAKQRRDEAKMDASTSDRSD